MEGGSAVAAQQSVRERVYPTRSRKSPLLRNNANDRAVKPSLSLKEREGNILKPFPSAANGGRLFISWLILGDAKGCGTKNTIRL